MYPIDRNLSNKLLFILNKLQKGLFYWRNVRCDSEYAKLLFQKYNRKTSERSKPCRNLKSKCIDGKITERELHFCKRRIEDKIPLRSPNDLDLTAKVIANSKDIMLAYLRMKSEEEKVLIGKLFNYNEIKLHFLPIITYPETITVWFLSCKLNKGENKIQILTLYPSKFKDDLKECFIYEIEKLKRTKKPSTNISKILIPPIWLNLIES